MAFFYIYWIYIYLDDASDCYSIWSEGSPDSSDKFIVLQSEHGENHHDILGVLKPKGWLGPSSTIDVSEDPLSGVAVEDLDEVAVELKLLKALKQFLGPFSSLVLHFEPEGSQVHEVACQLKKLKKGGGEGLWSGEQFGESFILGLKSDDSPGDHCFFVEFVEAVVGSESAVGLNNRRHKS